MESSKLKICSDRIARYCNFGLVTMNEYEEWLHKVAVDVNETKWLRNNVSSGYATTSKVEPDWSIMCDAFNTRYDEFWEMLTAANWAQIAICVLGILINCICKFFSLLLRFLSNLITCIFSF